MAGELNIPGLKKTVDDVKALKSEMLTLVDILAKNTKAANEVSDANKKNAKTLSEVTNQAKAQAKSEEQNQIARVKLEKISKELLITEERLAKAKIATESAQKRLEAQTNRMVAAKKRGSEATNTWSKALGSFQTKFNTVGNALGLAVAGGILGAVSAFKAAINITTEFEKKLDELQAITGASGDDLAYLKNSAIDLSLGINSAGIQITASASEILEGFKMVASAKPELLSNARALKEVTEQTLILAEASGMTLKDSVSSLTTIMNQFDASADESARYINVLAAGAKFGAAEIPYLADAISKTGTAANASGLSIEQTTAIMEVFAEKGIASEKAGVGFRNILIELLKDTKNYKGGLFDINLAFTRLSEKQNDVIALEKQFGKENVIQAQILAQNKDRFDELTASVNGTSVAYEQALINSENFANSTERAGNATEGLVLSMQTNTGLLKGVVDLYSLAAKGVTTLNLMNKAFKGDTEALMQLTNRYQTELDAYSNKANLRLKTELDAAKARLKATIDQAENIKKLQEEEIKSEEEKTEKQKKEYEKQLIAKQKLNEDLLESDRKARLALTESQSEFDKLMLTMDEDSQKSMLEGLQRTYDEQINIINDNYTKQLEAANGNSISIQQAQETRDLALQALEMMHTTTMLSTVKTGTDKEAELLNQLSDLKVKIAESESDKKAKIDKEEQKREEEKYAKALKVVEDYGSAVGDIFGGMITSNKNAAKEGLKSMVHMALQAMKAYAYTQLGIATAGSFATPDSILTFGTTGAVRALILAGLITAGTQVAEMGVNSLIDSFEKGTKDAPGGPAIINEKGTELIKTPDGIYHAFPGQNVFLPDLPKHSQVIPHHLIDQEMQEVLKMPGIEFKNDNKEVVKLLKQLNRKSTTSISIDQNGFRVAAKQGLSTTRFLDDYYRC